MKCISGEIKMRRIGVTYSTHWLKVGWVLLFEISWVGNLARSPDTLVGRVVNERCGPFALVSWVLDHWLLPFSASRDIVTLGVWYGWCDPITIFLLVPISWHSSFWVWDSQWLVL